MPQPTIKLVSQKWSKKEALKRYLGLIPAYDVSNGRRVGRGKPKSSRVAHGDKEAAEAKVSGFPERAKANRGQAPGDDETRSAGYWKAKADRLSRELKIKLLEEGLERRSRRSGERDNNPELDKTVRVFVRSRSQTRSDRRLHNDSRYSRDSEWDSSHKSLNREARSDLQPQRRSESTNKIHNSRQQAPKKPTNIFTRAKVRYGVVLNKSPNESRDNARGNGVKNVPNRRRRRDRYTDFISTGYRRSREVSIDTALNDRPHDSLENELSIRRPNRDKLLNEDARNCQREREATTREPSTSRQPAQKPRKQVRFDLADDQADYRNQERYTPKFRKERKYPDAVRDEANDDVSSARTAAQYNWPENQRGPIPRPQRPDENFDVESTERAQKSNRTARNNSPSTTTSRRRPSPHKDLHVDMTASHQLNSPSGQPSRRQNAHKRPPSSPQEDSEASYTRERESPLSQPETRKSITRSPTKYTPQEPNQWREIPYRIVPASEMQVRRSRSTPTILSDVTSVGATIRRTSPQPLMSAGGQSMRQGPAMPSLRDWADHDVWRDV